MRENVYQAKLIKTLKRLFPGCVILKNDSSYLQGIPDLVIFYGDQWAMLEVKTSVDADVQPNQDYYIKKLDIMSFASYIYPEIEEEVLCELQQTLQPRRSARTPVRKQVPLDRVRRR